MVMNITNWDEETYKQTIIYERESQSRTIFRSIFAPNSNPNPNPSPDILVAASSDGYIASYSLSSSVFSMETSYSNPSPQQVIEAEPRWFLKAHEGPAYDVKFYDQGPESLLLSCGDDGQVLGWKWKELEECEEAIQKEGRQPVVQLINPQHKGPWGALSPVPENNAIAVDPQAGSVFVAAGDSCAYGWDLETSKIKMVYKGHSDYLHCIVARNSSNQIITGSEDGTARLWDCRNGKCVQVMHPVRDKSLKEVSSISCIALDASESWLACGSGRNLFVWNLLASEQISKILAPTSCQDIIFDEKNILVVGTSPILSRMDMNGKILSQIRCAPESAFSLSLHQSGIVAVAGYGGLIDVISQFDSHLCTFRCTSL